MRLPEITSAAICELPTDWDTRGYNIELQLIDRYIADVLPYVQLVCQRDPSLPIFFNRFNRQILDYSDPASSENDTASIFPRLSGVDSNRSSTASYSTAKTTRTSRTSFLSIRSTRLSDLSHTSATSVRSSQASFSSARESISMTTESTGVIAYV